MPSQKKFRTARSRLSELALAAFPSPIRTSASRERYLTRVSSSCRSGTRSNLARQSGRYSGQLLCSRSEEHTSELQSRFDLVCRLLLEKKKQYINLYRDRSHPTS